MKIDLIVAHFAFESGNAAEYVSRINKIPYIIVEHSSGFMTNSKVLPITRSVYQNANAVIAVSNFLSMQIEEFSGVKPFIIPNVIDENIFFYKKLQKNDLRIISVGRLIPWKQFNYVIGSAYQLIKSGFNICVDIVGVGSEEKKLKKLVKKLGIEKNIIFHGTINNEKIADMYRESTVFVLPSKGETFGVVYAEALACGVPVVATKVGGAIDFVNDTNGKIVDCSYEKNIFEAIFQILKNYNKYDGEKISSNIISKYGKKEFIYKFQKIINAIGICDETKI